MRTAWSVIGQSPELLRIMPLVDQISRDADPPEKKKDQVS
jgi:hypothetical protein